MNLVKLQDDLRMLPMALLDAKAKGQDPNVPAWLATGVLNEKLDAQKRAGLAQGAAKGSLPSVAEQIQQKAGLMALQGQRQQQSQQQMGEQAARAPTPTAENTPQPEGQPQEEFAAAGGGIARLPVDPRMFDYRGGGIIAFAGDGEEGSKVPSAYVPLERREGEDFEDYFARVDAEESRLKKERKAALPSTYITPSARSEGESFVEYRNRIIAEQDAKKAAKIEAERQANEAVRKAAVEQRPRLSSPFAQAGTDPGAPRAGIAAVAPPAAAPPPAAVPPPPAPAPAPAPAPRPQIPRPQAPQPQAVAPAPVPPAQGIAQLPVERTPTDTGVEGMLMESLKAKYKAPTLDELKAERASATPESLRQPAGLEQLARLNEMQKKREAGASGRKLDEITQSMLGIGLPGGYGAAAMRAGQAATAADEAFAGDQNKLRSAIEADQRGEATAEQTALLSGLATGRAATATAGEARQKDLAQVYGTQTTAKTQAAADLAHANSALAVAKLGLQGHQYTADQHLKGVLASAAQRGDTGEVKALTAAITLVKNDRGIAALEKMSEDASKSMIPSERLKAAGYLKQIEERTIQLYESQGVRIPRSTMPTAPGAAGPGGLKYNPATGKIE